jgi:hypothetical protein
MYADRAGHEDAELYYALLSADDEEDTAALARLGWILIGAAAESRQAEHEMAALLGELRAAAGAALAGAGSPASLALLRHVLAKQASLPPADNTPLQVVAAPRTPRRPVVTWAETRSRHDQPTISPNLAAG